METVSFWNFIYDQIIGGGPVSLSYIVKRKDAFSMQYLVSSLINSLLCSPQFYIWIIIFTKIRCSTLNLITNFKGNGAWSCYWISYKMALHSLRSITNCFADVMDPFDVIIISTSQSIWMWCVTYASQTCMLSPWPVTWQISVMLRHPKHLFLSIRHF